MKPILFNTEMVKAILDGRKTQTRRPIKLNIKKDNETHSLNGAVFTIDNKLYFEHNLIKNFSKYKIGDILYAQEPYYKLGCWAFSQMCDSEDHESTGENCFNTVAYEDNIDTYDLAYPVFEYDLENAETMGEEDARILLEVTNVRVERLQDMKEYDAYREGVDYINSPHYGKLTETRYKDYENNKIDYKHYNAKESFISFWNSIAKDGYKWEDNPYVFVYEFERIVKDD